MDVFECRQSAFAVLRLLILRGQYLRERGQPRVIPVFFLAGRGEQLVPGRLQLCVHPFQGLLSTGG